MNDQYCHNTYVNKWIEDQAKWLKPDKVVWITGEESQYKEICAQLERDGRFVRVNEKAYPNSFWCRSHPNDVARVEDRTFICSVQEDDAGPLNNWRDPIEMKRELHSLMEGVMRGRTMYVIPYLMGPVGSRYARMGFELTDSRYVVANMYIMAKVGRVALEHLPDDSRDFVRGVHSYGDLNPEKRYIVHFPETREIISFNSDYGGNALQGKKCFALRIASVIARDEGWMAEHMLILGITPPNGKTRYICAAFPSACGKTNLAMLDLPEMYKNEGWKVETLGDDIAWLNFGQDGRLYAINPENGFFGVAPGTSLKTNPNMMKTLEKGNSIFTNTAFDLESRTPWWEGLGEPPAEVVDWLGNRWEKGSKKTAAHPNSRFTTPIRQCPILSKEFDNPIGVPISAILFGGRRSTTTPLVFETKNWRHGTYVGLTMASETTAAAAGKVGVLRRDPMSMKPFIGYHVGDYARHWLKMGEKGGDKMPKIFHVNWFRKNKDGSYIWPGFGENIRVLEWIIDRLDNKADGVDTPIGILPTVNSIRTDGINVSRHELGEILSFSREEWMAELDEQERFLTNLGSKLPGEILNELARIRKELSAMAPHTKCNGAALSCGSA